MMIWTQAPASLHPTQVEEGSTSAVPAATQGSFTPEYAPRALCSLPLSVEEPH